MRIRSEEEYIKDWQELIKLASRNDISGFYKRYAKYLKDNGLISAERRTLYRMANGVVAQLEEAQVSKT